MTDAPSVVDRDVRRARLGRCVREARLEALALERLDDPATGVTAGDPRRHDARPEPQRDASGVDALASGQGTDARRPQDLVEHEAGHAARCGRSAGLGVMQRSIGAPLAGGA